MYKRTYILGAIYIIGNRVYVNCMCNREIDDITLNSWFYQLYHKCDIQFSLMLFFFFTKEKPSIFAKEDKKYGYYYQKHRPGHS